MHPSPEGRPSIKALITLILSAGFGSAAVVSALLIIVGSESAQQGGADRHGALFTALAVEVTTELHHDPLPDEERLPPGAQETIFRVVQEALSNTARHARARHARVTIMQEMAEGREWLR
ncbi:MAG: hypothetical protein SNJ51_03225, partial [Roseiflexus sp.]